MDWLRRKDRPAGPVAASPADTTSAATERSSPGLAEFFDRLEEDRSHAVLDLGSASDASLQVYGRFARWVRFADLLAFQAPGGWVAALDAVPPLRERPYDLVFVWDVLDRIEPSDRPRLIQKLADLTAPNAKLFLVVASATSPDQSLKFSLTAPDRMRYEPSGRLTPSWSAILPAEVERLLMPFHVTRAFTSKVGLREYVAARKPTTKSARP